MKERIRQLVTGWFSELTREEDNNKQILIFFSRLTVSFAIFYGLVRIFIVQDVVGMLVCFSHALVCYFIKKLTEYNFNIRVLVYLFVFSGFVAIYYNAFVTGGISSTVIAWTIFLPLMPLLILGLTDALVWLGIILISNVLLWQLANITPEYNGVGLNPVFNLVVIQGLNLLIFLFCYFFYSTRDLIAEKLKGKNSELEETKNNLIESQNHKDIFIANISHELRNPLGIILGLLSIVEKNESDRKLKGYLSESRDAANHLLSIINDLLDISNLESGRISIVKSNFNIHKLINATNTYFDNKVQQKDIRYRVDTHPGTPARMYNDAIRITQIVNNLIDNAIKYTEKGLVSLACELKDDSLVIKVSDTGMGIPPDKIGNIFDNFYRVNYDNSISGTGLGLSIVKEIVEKLNGQIQAESVLNLGTSITIRIPYELKESADEGHQEIELSNIRKELSGLRVLVAEDMQLNQVILEDMLSENISNLNVEFVNDGFGVLEKLRAKEFDIILMDINMPNKNGIETTKEIRMQYGEKHKIIALTANALKKDVDASKLYGINEYATKPIQINDLLMKMYTVLQ